MTQTLLGQFLLKTGTNFKSFNMEIGMPLNVSFEK